MATFPELDQLISDIAAEDTVIDSAVTFITGVPALIDAAVQKALAAGASPEALAAITGLSTDVKAKAQALATAMTANTPTPPVTVPPTP